MTPQTPLDVIEQIAKLESEATPGPWFARGDGYAKSGAELWNVYPAERKPANQAADAQLLAALRNHAASLLADARRLHEIEAELAAEREKVAAMERLIVQRYVESDLDNLNVIAIQLDEIARQVTAREGVSDDLQN